MESRAGGVLENHYYRGNYTIKTYMLSDLILSICGEIFKQIVEAVLEIPSLELFRVKFHRKNSPE